MSLIDTDWQLRRQNAAVRIDNNINETESESIDGVLLCRLNNAFA